MLRWIRKAADQEHASSQCVLANMYYDGKHGLPLGHQEATRLFVAAAEQGHADAKAFLNAISLQAVALLSPLLLSPNALLVVVVVRTF
jgi:TPR repeat protein